MTQQRLEGPFLGVGIDELARRLRQGTSTAVEMTQAALAAGRTLGAELGCFTFLDEEGALRSAEQADAELARGIDRGPLHGIPVGVKDVIAVAGLPMTMGSRHFEHHVATRDAGTVVALRQAGAVIVGKTQTHELAYGPTADRSLQGPSRNPHDTSRIAGGSSGGSASAVAAGILPAALGTDTGGSVRIPAALCGIVGFRPTQGSLSGSGVFPLSETFDIVGPMAANAADVSVLWEALTCSDPSARRHAPAATLERTRFGVVRSDLTGRIVPEQASALATAVESLAMAGATAEDVALPELDECLAPYAAIQSAEAFAIHRERVRTAPELFDAEVLERLEAASRVAGWEYVAALKQRSSLSPRVHRAMRGLDLLILPTVPITAPEVGSRGGPVGAGWSSAREALLALTSPWSVLGLPAVSVPVPWVGGRLPVAVQLVARPGEDRMLIEVAALLEQALERDLGQASAGSGRR